jgi:predicted tellurium resistance membrane protein TerC
MHAVPRMSQEEAVGADLLVLVPTVDNLFVFILVFNYLKVPRDDQNKVGMLTTGCVP